MEQRTRDKPKQSVKAIIGDGDNWVRYQEAYAGKVTEDQIKEVEKMLGCGGGCKMDTAPTFVWIVGNK